MALTPAERLQADLAARANRGEGHMTPMDMRFAWSPEELKRHAHAVLARLSGGPEPEDPVAAAMASSCEDLHGLAEAHDPRRGAYDPSQSDPHQVFTRGFNSSDFAETVADGVAGVAAPMYDATVSGAIDMLRPVPRRDFKAGSVPQFGAGTLEPTPESLETLPVLSLSESEALEVVSIDEHSHNININRRVILGSEVDVLQTLGAEIGQSVGRTVLKSIATTLETTDNLADGRALFNSTDGNLASVGAGPSAETLDAGIQVLRNLTNPAGDKVGAGARFMVVPPALEMTVRILLSVIYPPNDPDRLRLVVLPWLTSDTAWYLLAAPMAAPTLALYHLRSAAERPFRVEGMRRRQGASGVQIGIGADFKVARIGRFMFKNPGA